jgi:type III restriction enzyme
MKFTLKDYQDEAVRDVLQNLRRAEKDWREGAYKSSFSLTAVTGAGKTVMAAAVFEALFHGDDNYDFEADPTAVVVWFSYDPSLNEQTRFRLMESSDRLNPSDLVVVDYPFNQKKFQAGKIYFLNTQKLSKSSRLVRGYDADDPLDIRPDGQSYTLWDIFQNTIEDPDLTLYFVLDEAHRGLGANKAAQEEGSTILKRLINGHGNVPPMPIVWGISATVERFQTAMRGARNRAMLPDVVVDPEKVQESGLLKDTIILDIPKEAGDFDTVLLRRAARKMVELSRAWDEYAREQGLGEPVKPLMVLQVPNKPDEKEVGQALDIIRENWPDLTYDAFAHVFGEHTAQAFGGHTVDYISPERVQESSHVRVLIAKDAISTGWDCPRAEVMLSFRPAKDRTHITQLLGRMVRTPLARRIPGNDRLNSVECLLPRFEPKTVEEVVQALQKGGVENEDTPLPGRRVLVGAKEMTPNPAVPEAVWEKFDSLPSQSIPQRGANPIKRLTALAHELAFDKLLPDAGKKAHAELHKVLDGLQARYASEIAEKRQSMLAVVGESRLLTISGEKKSYNEFVEDADFAVIDYVYARASRGLTSAVAKSYVEHLVRKKTGSETLNYEALMEARTDVAALALVEEIEKALEEEADKLANQWLNDFRVDIRGLSDERQEVYRQIKSWSPEPQDIDLTRPASWMQPTVERHPNGTETPLPLYKHHLLCDENGDFPAEMNEWENDVLAQESQRSGFIAWFRNPSRSSQDSLGIAYKIGEAYKVVRPDFIFFAQLPNGSIVADIVDPHGTFLADSLPKLQGLARYAEEHPGVFRRIDAVAKVGDKARVLDMAEPDVRAAVLSARDAKSLYESSVAGNYEPSALPL